MMNDKTFTFVKSNYKSAWKGIVLDIYTFEHKCYRNTKYVVYKVLIVKDKNGNTPRKKIIKRLNRNWLEEIEPFDITHINKDWYER